MLETKKINLITLALCFLFAGGIYIFDEFFCTRNCYIVYESVFLEPLFFTLLGLLPALTLLMFFSDRIFSSWLKHIAWWFMLVILLMITSNENESSFSNFDSDVWIINMSTGILFIITLVYALIMNRRLKKQGV